MARKAPRTAFKKGQSGNPKGRPPRGETISGALREMLEKKCDQVGFKKKRWLEVFAETVVKRACAGDDGFARILSNYVDGLPKQRFEDGEQERILFILGEDEGENGNGNGSRTEGILSELGQSPLPPGPEK